MIFMRYVIAVGGNAIQSSKALNKLSASVVSLSVCGNEVVITHGNGPQVGELALREKKSLARLTEETQALVGSEIRSSIAHVDKKAGEGSRIVRTHVLVSGDDEEFVNPTKPIGRFYGRAAAERLAGRGFVMKRLLKGYRRVVPSPKPRRIVEVREIEKLLKSGHIVIAAGGGGIAVTGAKKLRYADAVIDKDLASSLLAVKIKADILLILTNVDGVIVGFHTRKARLLERVSVAELKRHAMSEHFEAGSMLPKVQACIDFVGKTGKRAVIGNLSKPEKVLGLKGATVVVPS